MRSRRDVHANVPAAAAALAAKTTIRTGGPRVPSRRDDPLGRPVSLHALV